MKIKFYHIPAIDFEESENELNNFCASKRVASIEKEFVLNGDRSFWSICVSYIEKSEILKTKGKIDYKEVFDEQDFALFVKLRELRRKVAESEGVPAYALFTNEQLSIIVRDKIEKIDGLNSISGIGKSRIDKYGQMFVDIVKLEIEKKSDQNS